MTRLVDLAKMLRSKNSGPFLITLDVLFDKEENYRRVKESGVINEKNICRLYHLSPEDLVCIVFFDHALGIKITYNRETPSGTCFDRDVYGAQQHAPLMGLMIPEKGSAVFMDIQGTLGGDPLGTVTDFEFYDGALDSIRRINEAGYRIFAITNQSKISKGLISREDFDRGLAEINSRIEDAGGHVEQYLVCPHQESDRCDCRKPSLKMPLEVAARYGLKLENCYFIGDSIRSDMGMASAAGGTGILVLTGQSAGRQDLLHSKENPGYMVCVSMEEATDIVTGKRK